VPSRFVLEFDWRDLRLDEDTWSGSKVNRRIGEFLGQAVPSVHFARSIEYQITVPIASRAAKLRPVAMS